MREPSSRVEGRGDSRRLHAKSVIALWLAQLFLPRFKIFDRFDALLISSTCLRLILMRVPPRTARAARPPLALAALLARKARAKTAAPMLAVGGEGWGRWMRNDDDDDGGGVLYRAHRALHVS